MIVRELLFKLGLSVNRRSFQQAEQGVQRIQHQASVGATKVNKMGGAMMGMVATLGLAGAAIAGGQALVKTIADVESLKASLETLTGSAEEANRVFDQLSDFAKRTPFQLEELTQGYMRLKGAGLDPSIEALTAYGDTAAAKNKDFMQWIEAVADAATGEFERLKEFDIVSKSVGNKVKFTFNGVTTSVEKNAQAIEGYLKSIGQTRFAGGMERQSKTFNGMMSTLMDNASAFAVAVGEAGLLDALKELMTVLLDTGKGGGGLAKVLGFVLAQAVKSITILLKVATSIIRTLADLFRRLVPKELIDRFKKWREESGKTAKALFLLMIPILGLLLLIEDFIAFLQGRKSVIGNFVEQLKDAPGLFGMIARAILFLTSKELWNKITEGFNDVKQSALDFWDSLQPIFSAIGDAWEFIKIIAIRAWEFIKKAAVPVIAAAKRLVIDLGERWKQIQPHIEKVGESISKVVGAVVRLVRRVAEFLMILSDSEGVQEFGDMVIGVWEGIVKALEFATGLIKDAFQGTLVFFLNVISLMMDGFSGFVNGVIDFIDALPEMFFSAWKTVMEWLQDILNGAIGVINDVISTANELPGVDISTIGKVSFDGAAVATADKGALREAFAGAPSNTIGNVMVQIQGTTGMGPDEVSKATEKGLQKAMVSESDAVMSSYGGV